MNTKVLQAELFDEHRRIPIELDERVLFNKQTFLGALKYVIQCGNFELDKQIYQALGIDAGNWTRIMNGTASFPQDKEEPLQDLCGNHGLAMWRARRRGFGVIPLRSDLETRIQELESNVSEKEKIIQMLTGLLKR